MNKDALIETTMDGSSYIQSKRTTQDTAQYDTTLHNTTQHNILRHSNNNNTTQHNATRQSTTQQQKNRSETDAARQLVTRPGLTGRVAGDNEPSTHARFPMTKHQSHQMKPLGRRVNTIAR